MVQLTRKEWEHMKYVSEEQMKGALMTIEMAKLQLKLAEDQLAKLPKGEDTKNAAVK